MLDIEILNGFIPVIILVGTISFLLYCLSTRNFDYWKKRNVPFAKPLPFIGSAYQTTTQPHHEAELQRYKELGRIFGYFEGTRPLLSVGDPKLIRNILVKDFHVFSDRRPIVAADNMVDKQMPNAMGEDWKRIRSICTPTLATGKIKKMISIMMESAEIAVENFKSVSKNGSAVDANRIFGAFSLDVIARAAFSTEIDSYNDPDNRLVKIARKTFSDDLNWRFAMFYISPNLMKWLNICVYPPDVNCFFQDLVGKIIEQRKKTGQTRNDFLQLMIDTAQVTAGDQKSALHEKETDDIASTYGEVSTDHAVFRGVSNKNLTQEEMVAQCVLFFLVGYETSSSTLAFITYALALYPKVQEKVHAELVKAVENSNGKLTYDALQNVKYLDYVISEALRLYPPITRFERQCSADYKLGDSGITIPKGMIVSVPSYAIQRDPEYFPNPELFDPDRWSEEEKAKRDQYTFLPFGAGPRNCVGMRFALIEVKVCMAYVILNFKINKCSKTTVPLEYKIVQGMLKPKDLFVSMEERKNNHLVK